MAEIFDFPTGTPDDAAVRAYEEELISSQLHQHADANTNKPTERMSSASWTSWRPAIGLLVVLTVFSICASTWLLLLCVTALLLGADGLLLTSSLLLLLSSCTALSCGYAILRWHRRQPRYPAHRADRHYACSHHRG